MLASSAVRQALVPVAAGYLIWMSALALGLRRLYRPEKPRLDRAGAARRRGWTALAWQVAGTVVGGYLLLMAVVVGYFSVVSRVGRGFLESAATGTALLAGLAAPVFAAASWLAERLRRRGREPGSGTPQRGKPP